MSKTGQRKRQAYEEGHRHGAVDSGRAYRRHPFMRQYMAGYRAGLATLGSVPKVHAEREFRKTLTGRFLAWLIQPIVDLWRGR